MVFNKNLGSVQADADSHWQFNICQQATTSRKLPHHNIFLKNWWAHNSSNDNNDDALKDWQNAQKLLKPSVMCTCIQ